MNVEIRILATNIIAGHPTRLGNIYPRDVLQKAINKFNAKARKRKVYGCEMDHTDITNVDDPMFFTKRLFLNESNVLCAEIQILDTKSGEKFLNRINESNEVIARPIMCVPQYIHEKVHKDNENTIVEPLRGIDKIQVEYR